MGKLVLVRHGQAMFHGDDYDQLSPLGEEQMRQLGAFWAQHGFVPDRVVSGPLKRQRHSAAIVKSVCGSAWPEPETVEAWSELPAEAMAQRFLPQLAAECNRTRELLSRFQESKDPGEKETLFQEVFVKAMEKWVRGEFSDPEILTWSDFAERIQRAVTVTTQNGAADGTVVAFTSGGPTAATVHLALGMDPVRTMELAWQARNGSLNEFIVQDGRLLLNSFNSVPHLPDPKWWTYR